jgi:hypothetical protein
MKRAAALLIALVLVLAACGDDDAGTDTTAGDTTATTSAGGGDVVDELTREILSDSSTGSDGFTEEQAACFAVGLVDEFGAEVMVDALQMEFEEFMAAASLEDRMTVVDTMLDCVDFGAVMVAELDGEISAESANCIGDAFGNSEAFRNALANSFDGSATDPFDDPALMEDILPAMFECLTEEELTAIMGGSLEG